MMPANGSRTSRRSACRSKPKSRRWRKRRRLLRSIRRPSTAMLKRSMDWPRVLLEHAEAEDDRGPLVKSFRALVHSVTIHPNGPREGFQVEVKGKLAALIGGEAFPQAVYSGGRVVAEVRYIALPTMDDAVFCYWRRTA